MKKTKYIELVLITAALASCNQSKPKSDWEEDPHLHVRSDSTAPYQRVRHHHGASPFLWYYAFRPYGNYYNGMYSRTGYYSNAINHASNIGSNGMKGAVTRGGFGRGSFSVGG